MAFGGRKPGHEIESKTTIHGFESLEIIVQGLSNAEDQRAAMSRCMVSVAGTFGLDQLLDQLDSTGNTRQRPDPTSYLMFSTFSVVPENEGNLSNVTRDGQTVSDLLCHADSIPSPSTSPDSSDEIYQRLNGQHITGYELGETAVQESAFPNDTLVFAGTPSLAADLENFLDLYPCASFPPQLPWNASGGHLENDLSQATFLLDHYRVQMLKLFSPRGGQKPPWAVLHLPTAMSTMSELSLWGKSSHAKTSLFYALLSVSAFNIDRVSANKSGAPNYWWNIGDGLRERAKQEIKQSLTSELTGPKQSKYKEVLMALLTMVTVSVVSGRQTDARSFLLDAEHFICVRGIPKPTKSRKVRMLHQIYLFLRVIEESTHVYSTTTSKKATDGGFPSPLDVETSLFPSLKTHSARLGNDLDVMSGGSFESELIGRSMQELSLFGEIYGIPISLLSLLSQVTSLANHIEEMNFMAVIPSRLQNIGAHCQNLEDAILGWEGGTADSQSVLKGDVTTNQEILNHLVDAIKNALIVYFYRRIHDVHPQTLQVYVVKIIDHLAECELEKSKSSVIYNGIAWPGFIAATEALDGIQRGRVLHWLRESAQSSGFRNFDVAADIAEHIWKARSNGRPRVSWIDLVRENRVALILT